MDDASASTSINAAIASRAYQGMMASVIGRVAMMQQRRHGGRAALLIGSAVLALASAGNAQTVTLGPQGVTQSENLGRAFQTFSVFGGTPGIAAAQYYSNFDVNSFQLPMAHSFDPIKGGFLSGVAPYAEITLGYVT